jgi:protein O-GlcNAcase/histone acetyltransferase
MPGGSQSMQVEEYSIFPDKDLTVDDLALLCDLFYLPFEHGAQGLQLLQEFNWLKMNANLVVSPAKSIDESSREPEVIIQIKI